MVEIDESAWTKRKHNRRCGVSARWVFGGVNRDTDEYFAVLVERCNAGYFYMTCSASRLKQTE